MSSRLELNSLFKLHAFGDLRADLSTEQVISCKTSRLVIFSELLPEVSFTVK